MVSINLFNLIIGFTTFILLCVVVISELGYDKFNINYDRIYRVQTKQEDSSPTNFCAYSPPAFRYHLMNNLPEVEKYLLMKEASGQYFTLPDGRRLYDKYGYWSENSVFDIFTINFIEGSKENALTEPNTIALSETLAKKIFPQGNAYGKQLIIGEQHPLTVKAVYVDLPDNSSLKPSFLVSFGTFEALAGPKGFRDNWTNISNLNYVLLKKGADPDLVDEKIKDAFKYVEKFEKSTPYLRPLEKIHTSPNNQNDLLVWLSVLSFAAILILALSCVNYVNLSIANSTKRIKEIGIKKVIGLSKRLITLQFIFETVILTLFAAVISLFLAQALLPFMSNILLNNIKYDVLGNGQVIVIVALVAISTGVISGLYPSLVLASYNPAKALKGKIFVNSGKKAGLKKVLVATQFSISLFMLIISIIFYKQVNYISNKDLGFDNKKILFSEITTSRKFPFETIRNRILQHPEIEDISVSSTIPFLGNIGGYVSWEGSAPDEKVMISRNYVNYGFIPAYNLKMAEGRNFSKDFSSDNENCIINETAAKAFGWDNAVGKYLNYYDKKYPVIGVVKDFHAFSLHNAIPPYIMFLNNDTVKGNFVLSIRYRSENEQEARNIVSEELEAVIPDTPFSFSSFNDVFILDATINFWQSMKKVFLFFAFVTLIISSAGLFGLILYTTKRRVKEIGIRKVLGSSVNGIYRQLLFEVLGMLVFAIFIASPAAYCIYKAIPGAYKESLSVFEFVFSIGIVLAVVVATISYHVWKVAVSNPVEALKHE